MNKVYSIVQSIDHMHQLEDIMNRVVQVWYDPFLNDLHVIHNIQFRLLFNNPPEAYGLIYIGQFE